MGLTRKDFLKMFGLGVASAGFFRKSGLAAEKAEPARSAVGAMKIRAVEIFKLARSAGMRCALISVLSCEARVCCAE